MAKVKLTRGGVALDIEKTPYTHKIEYDNHTIVYHFTSDLYRKKFIERLKGEREKINLSLSNRFGFRVRQDILSDLRLYEFIEKRAFLVTIDGVKIKCQTDIILDGVKVTMKT